MRRDPLELLDPPGAWLVGEVLLVFAAAGVVAAACVMFAFWFFG